MPELFHLSVSLASPTPELRAGVCARTIKPISYTTCTDLLDQTLAERTNEQPN